MLRVKWLVGLAICLAGCTTVPVDLGLPLSKNDHCASPVGASMQFNTLTLGLGVQPSPGYEAELIVQEPQTNQFKVQYQIVPPTMTQPRQRTQPCVQLVLPRTWQQLEVVLYPQQQRWLFTPQELKP